MSLEDPYFVVRDEVLQSLSGADALFARWRELVSAGRGGDELDWTANELHNTMRSIDWDLEDLQETIGIVQSNPAKFALDQAEIGRRKTFVETTRERVRRMRSEMESSQRAQRERDPLSSPKAGPGGDVGDVVKGRSVATKGRGANRYQKLDDALEAANDDFMRSQQRRQEQVIAEQDIQLDKVARSVGTLKQIGSEIGRELDEQAIMLDDFDAEVDATSTRLGQVLKKTNRVLEMAGDKKSTCCIFMLMLSLIILIVVYFAV